jgi:hypothetical protein
MNRSQEICLTDTACRAENTAVKTTGLNSGNQSMRLLSHEVSETVTSRRLPCGAAQASCDNRRFFCASAEKEGVV